MTTNIPAVVASITLMTNDAHAAEDDDAENSACCVCSSATQ